MSVFVDTVCVYDLLRSTAFSSKAEEIAEIRGFCRALIHNLLPKHLWEPNVYYCAFQEILALKG